MGQILEGVKIADFSWMIAGSRTAKYLADHGAQVIHIESMTHIDPLRTTGPFKNKKPGVNRSAIFAGYNNDKYGITLNLSHPKGPEIARKLVQWADIVIENFTAGKMKKWGLDYDSLRAVKPDIIMISLSNQGQTGPRREQSTTGFQLTALSGFAQITGWPDSTPLIPYGAYTDIISPRFAASTIIAALDYHRRTGKGQYLDLSQYEASIHFLSPLILDFTVNGRVANRVGNNCPYSAPHGAFPCNEEDSWCAIAVFSDEEWESFCQAMDNPDWTKDAKFGTLLSRKENEDELNKLIAGWTRNYTAQEVMVKLQSSGVVTGIVETCEDLFNDPQLKYRHHFKQLEHAEIGKHHYMSPSFKLSKTPADLKRAAPCIGQDNVYVYTNIIGVSDEEFVDLIEEGVIQ